MDELTIRSKFMKRMISKLAKKALYQKCGYNTDVSLNDLSASMTDERARVHLDIDLYISKKEFEKMLKNIC